MREIYSITIYQRINNIEGLVKLNHTLTDELVSALLLATESSYLLSSVKQAEINRIVQSSKAKMKNGAMSAKRLAKYLNWHTRLFYRNSVRQTDSPWVFFLDFANNLGWKVILHHFLD